MVQKVFGVRDSKALAFLQPFFSASTGAAVRAFGDAINEGNSPLAKHPEDYLLYELADFDDSTGEFISCNPIKMLGCGADFVQVKIKSDLSSVAPISMDGIRSAMEREVVTNGK